MSKKHLSKNSEVKRDLVSIGLTEQESAIYLFLLENPFSTYSALAQELSTQEPSIHRSIARLKEYGLVRTYGRKPVELQAVDPSVGLEAWVKNRQKREEHRVGRLLKSLRTSPGEKNELRVEVVEGKEETFMRSIELVKRLKNEMTILSIGEPIPEELFHAIVGKIKEGVSVRMIAEEYHKENEEMLQNWQRNGYQVRYLADPKLDFTLVVYDDSVAMLHIRMDPERDKRTGIFFYNPGYVKAQKQYLDELWEKAVELKDVEVK